MEDLYIIAGLGNPGKRYYNTRHNVGFVSIDLLSEKYKIKVAKLKFKALIGEGEINGDKVVLIKPQTFMNLSGESIREAVNWYKIPMDNLIIIYDDIDLSLGNIRIRQKGSAGTHNGMKSVIYQLQSDEFPRIRIGIDRPPENWDLADYVLSKFNGQEKEIISENIEKAVKAVGVIIESGVEAAMNLFNG